MAAAAAVVTVGAALGLRAVAAGAVATYGGDALCAVLPPALVVLVAPRWTPLRAAGTAPAVSWAVELFRSAVGAAGGGLLHIAMSRRRRTPVVGDTPHTCRGTMRRRARIGGVRAAGPADRPTGHPGHMT
ncbi:DUF2809 domain-containing protein [Streptomyces virginiae]|uniref:DUF2809 domain-containing protein n=1 Tax=Streptomyces virginiae TaxID=1961 RepID=UPI0036E0218F